MIIPVILFVGPSRLVSMLEFGEHDDIDEVAQQAAGLFPDIIYWFAEMVIDAPKPELWPELEIEWQNWYGKIVTDNVYGCFPVQNQGQWIVSQLRLTENEFNSYMVQNSHTIVFVREVPAHLVYLDREKLS